MSVKYLCGRFLGCSLLLFTGVEVTFIRGVVGGIKHSGGAARTRVQSLTGEMLRPPLTSSSNCSTDTHQNCTRAAQGTPPQVHFGDPTFLQIVRLSVQHCWKEVREQGRRCLPGGVRWTTSPPGSPPSPGYTRPWWETRVTLLLYWRP